MKLIKITTDNEISVHEFPEGPYTVQNHALRELIGPHCELYELEELTKKARNFV